MDKTLFQNDPRDFALTMVSDGLVSADHLLLCALNYMSHDDVRDMLDCNELSPRFDENEELDESNTTLNTWFERDRQHVELCRDSDDSTICEWWDDAVTEAVEDGTLNPDDYHASALEYARETLGVQA